MLCKEIERLPVISSHEHISSLLSFGECKSIFFPSDIKSNSKPIRNTYLQDLFLTPYYAGLLFSGGYQYQQQCDIIENNIFKNINTSLTYTKNLGIYKVLVKAFNDLYLTSEEELCDIIKLNKLNDYVKENYSDYIFHYEKILEKSYTKKVIKPVHPQYLDTMQKDNKGENRYSLPIIRIDSLLGINRNGLLTFSDIEKVYNIKITSIDDVDVMIDKFFNHIQGKSVGIKHLQAYTRTLNVLNPTREEADKALKVALSQPDQTSFILASDYIMRLILSKANEYRMPLQIHTGMTTLNDSNPKYLENLIKEYPNIKFILLHCYPYIDESAYLARIYNNCYLDTSWLLVQGLGVLREALKKYAIMVPYHKITISIDATSVEEYYGGITLSKQILTQVLNEMVEQKDIDYDIALKMAKAYLCENAQVIYNIK